MQIGIKMDDRKQQLAEIINPLLNWFDGHKRILPWREEPTPYRVWVSEIMLQQTRVEAVKPYYERFMNELPTVESLANAKEDTLLKLWEGLGYYNRVRNLQKAAIEVLEDFGGNIPDEFEELLKLPGIGRYTAGAVASIAYGKAVPAVDGNVLRVITRVILDDSDILKQSVKNQMELILREIMTKERPGDFNQALMELGAMICVPNGAPKCENCPLQFLCEARAQGVMEQYPKKTPKKKRVIIKKTIFIIRDGEKTVLHKRENKGLLAGLYEFPNVEGHLSIGEALEVIKSLDFAPIRIQELEATKHIFSHREWHMKAYAIKIEYSDLEREDDFFFAYSSETENKYPIPSAFYAYTKYLNIRIGNEKFLGEIES